MLNLDLFVFSFMLKPLTVVCFLVFLFGETFGQLNLTKQNYIDTYKSIAVREMLSNGIPASITLAQGMLESGDGNSALAQKANNHFGIKCHGEWEGETYHQDDDAKNECFRKYKKAEESYLDHSQFLKSRDRYAALFKLKRTDFKGWAHGLKAAGYATNPQYPELLIKLITDWNLNEFDLLNQIPSDWSNVKNQLNSGLTESKTSVPKETIGVIFVNNIKTIRVKKGDTWASLSKKLGMGKWEFFRYNEIPSTRTPVEGEILYLQPKRRKSRDECHKIIDGETLWGISQKYGVKTKFLAKWNNLPVDSNLQTGQLIKLNRKACNHD